MQDIIIDIFREMVKGYFNVFAGLL